MYQNAINKIRGSIFPIFYKLISGNLTQLGIVGTGFFVSIDGEFITAYHVTTDAPSGSTLLYSGNVPYSPVTRPIEIEEVYSDSVKDIFIGRVSQGDLPPLELATENPQPGKSVCLCGYPLPRLSQNPNGIIGVGNVRQYWEPTFVIDSAQGTFDNREYHGFITQVKCLSGMSGGPVFDIEGLVYGMSVGSFTRTIQERDGSETPVLNGLAIGVERIKEVIGDKVSII